jgi:DNA polymerase-3 subunit delta
LRTTPEKLSAALRRGLAPVYLLSGAEPLTQGEAGDAIRAAARAAGFTEREVFFIERATGGSVRPGPT